MRLELLSARNRENMSKRFALFFSIFLLDQALPGVPLRGCGGARKIIRRGSGRDRAPNIFPNY
jgi:hypothetical protein